MKNITLKQLPQGLAICLLVSLFMLACTQKKSNPNNQSEVEEEYLGVNEQRYQDYYISFDSISNQEIKAVDDKLLLEPEYKKSDYSRLIKTGYLFRTKQQDSGMKVIRTIDSIHASKDVRILMKYFDIQTRFNSVSVTPADVMKELIIAREQARKNHSKFEYKFLNLIGNAQYRNGELFEALKTVEQYYQKYPAKNSWFVNTRYFEMKLLLYSDIISTLKKEGGKKNDIELYIKKMKIAVDSCRYFASLRKDSLLYMRTYDYEGRYFSFIPNGKKSIDAFRKYYNFLVSHNKVNSIAIGNLGVAFVMNHQPDSGIYYIRKGIDILKSEETNFGKITNYNSLYDAYVMKGDSKNALIALDSSYSIYRQNINKIQNEKVEELNKKFESERKDQDILTLKKTNDFNTQILNQQRWIFAILISLFAILIYLIISSNRQKVFKAKHEKILLENNHLQMEQRLRQNQLNPHFVYNSIANLQGMIMDNKKSEANKYLIYLTKMIRDVLELNRNDFISLNTEIKSLNNYINLQQMRFDQGFSVEFNTHDLEGDEILIPPMLIQPFVENSIEYGFKNMEEPGLLKIDIQEVEGKLHIRIQDNGLGIKQTANDLHEKQSLSQKLTEERLDFLFNKTEKIAFFSTTPNAFNGKGYLVEIVIPIITDF